MRLFKKKNLSYILVASMAMAALTGCSKEDKKTEDAVVEDNATVTEGALEETSEDVNEDATEGETQDSNEDITEESSDESADDATDDAANDAANDATEESTANGLTYTATTQGFGGDILATVTLNEDGSIADITVDVATETPALGGAAGPQVAAAIVENQSLAVDTVSGATVTSTAVINAVRIALTEAGSELAQ